MLACTISVVRSIRGHNLGRVYTAVRFRGEVSLSESSTGGHNLGRVYTAVRFRGEVSLSESSSIYCCNAYHACMCPYVCIICMCIWYKCMFSRRQIQTKLINRGHQHHHHQTTLFVVLVRLCDTRKTNICRLNAHMHIYIYIYIYTHTCTNTKAQYTHYTHQ